MATAAAAAAAAVVVRWGGVFAALLHVLCVFILVSTTGTANFAGAFGVKCKVIAHSEHM